MTETIGGNDFFGRRSEITLGGRKSPGWSWSPRVHPTSQFEIGVGNTICDKKLRNLRLTHFSPGKYLRVAEHILALRWLGLEGMNIVAPNEWPPYLMPGEMWKYISSSAHDTGKQIKWQTSRESVRFDYPEKRGGMDAFVIAEPNGHPTFVANITISYNGLGTMSRTYDLSKIPQEEILRIMSVGPQGWYWFRHIRWLMRQMGWPHSNRIVWPKFGTEAERQETLERFCEHRFVDLLGTFALLGHVCKEKEFRLPALRVTSQCAGHDGDLQVAKEVRLKHKF